MNENEWRSQAECLGMGPSLFFDDGYARAARRVCAQCSVRRECLDWALDHPMETRVGVWGGLSERARRAERRRRGTARVSTRIAAKCGTYSGWQRHRFRGEESCAACDAARVVYRHRATA